MAYTANLSTILLDVTSGSPAVYNYLRPNAFRFSIKDLPNVAYSCQSANLPSLNLGFAVQPTPFLDIPRIGDKNTFGDFTIRFLISENMSNYLELFEWLIALGFPNNYNQYKSFTGDRLSRFPFYKNGRGDTESLALSDGTLTILDSNNVPKTNIILKDLFPVSVEALDFDVTSSAVDYFVGIASFKYTSFTIEAL
jgi:hypothetical protein